MTATLPQAAHPASASAQRSAQIAWMGGVTALILAVSIGLYLINTYRYQQRLLDDAYITFRFAQHLVGGSGLTWNVGGERVEGYTSVLHLVLIALAMKVGLRRPWWN